MTLEAFLLVLRRELAAQFRVEPSHDGIERILEETKAHLEDTIAELIERGSAIEAATAAALARFGTASRVARAYGPQAPTFIKPRAELPAWRRWMRRLLETRATGWLADAKVALRGLSRSRGYTVAFVLTLGLGIGANTAIFSVVYGVWLRPLPYRDGDRLVYLRHSAKAVPLENAFFSVPEIEDYRKRASCFEGVAEFSSMTFTLLGVGEPKRVRAGIVTGNYFEVMGLGAHLGRLISEIHDGEAAPAAGVLTYASWHRLFDADPQIVGRTITVNDRPVEIIGVAEPAPAYPERADLYVNMVVSPHHLSASMSRDRVHRMTEAFARLAPGKSLESARAEVLAITRSVHQEHPEAYDPNRGYEVSVTRLRDELAAEARPTIFMLFGVAAFVLLIACANVANLTLARVTRRYEEWALRVSLGAKTWSLRRQLLVESLLPSIAGAALGVVLALGGVDLLASYIARYSARASEIRVDATVLGVALAVAIASACFFSLLPRLPGTGRRRLGWLSGARSTAGTAGRRLQRLLVVSQIAVTFVLLAGAGLLLETLWNLQQDDGGVALEEVLAMNVPVDFESRSVPDVFAHHRTILESVKALPGVRSAALGSLIPLKESPHGVLGPLSAIDFEIEGEPTPPGEARPRADFRIVSGEYFETLGMTLVQGRTFQRTDTRDAPKVVVVNQALADRHFPDGDVVGRRIQWKGDTLHLMGVTTEFRTIVGVVSDVKDYGVAEEVPQVIVNPVTEVPLASSLFVRTAEPDSVRRLILDRIRRIDPGQAVVDVGTLAQIRSEAISPQRLNATLVGAFAFLALVVAAVGVGGVLAFGVSQRTHEFGVRAALGANRSGLMQVVLREGAFLALFGVGAGIAASFLLAGLISGLLHDVKPTDPTTLGAAALGLTAVAIVASAIPAWRASEIDPVQALRED
jgi:predicted permease